jgi:acyl-CoA synthetase (NDP forming)
MVEKPRSKMSRHELESVFYPKSVAIVGVSSRPQGLQGTGAIFLEGLIRSNFKGKIYPINPKGGETLGLKVYPSIMDVPEPVDYAICCISRHRVVPFVKDCATKGLKAVHIFSSGFSEIDSEEGRRLEEGISSLAHESGIRIIGPNCLGPYCPESGLSFSSSFPRESGSVAFLSQSGAFCNYLVPAMAQRGVRFSKVLSYGNACDINECDLLEYFAADENTAVIAAYIEGVKDGKRFKRVLRETAQAKPVIVLKVGVAEAGARAVASHTGALAGSDEVWDHFLHQAGAIRVHDLEDLIDMVVTFTRLRLPSGRRASVLGIGGGGAVVAADDSANAGLIVPRFPAEVQNKLRQLTVSRGIGMGLGNPVDLSDQGWGILYDCAKVILDYDGIDLLIVQLPIRVFPSPYQDMMFPHIKELAYAFVKAYNESNKSMSAVITNFLSCSEDCKVGLECEQVFCEAGLPVYHSLNNAVKAIARFLDYHDDRAKGEK